MSGLLKPADVVPIADHLAIRPHELARDYLQPGTDEARKAMRPRMTPNGCVFLVNQRCAIHAVKPFECREAHHDNSSTKGLEIYHEAIDAWEDF